MARITSVTSLDSAPLSLSCLEVRGGHRLVDLGLVDSVQLDGIFFGHVVQFPCLIAGSGHQKSPDSPCPRFRSKGGAKLGGIGGTKGGAKAALGSSSLGSGMSAVVAL